MTLKTDMRFANWKRNRKKIWENFLGKTYKFSLSFLRDDCVFSKQAAKKKKDINKAKETNTEEEEKEKYEINLLWIYFSQFAALQGKNYIFIIHTNKSVKSFEGIT